MSNRSAGSDFAKCPPHPKPVNPKPPTLNPEESTTEPASPKNSERLKSRRYSVSADEDDLDLLVVGCCVTHPCVLSREDRPIQREPLGCSFAAAKRSRMLRCSSCFLRSIVTAP